nr:hypothetical protein CPGR_04985 [Mycolicibacterium komanii]
MSYARACLSPLIAAAISLLGPLLLFGAIGTAKAACYNPNSGWPGWTDSPPPGMPPCPMEKVLVTCEWGQAYGPICPGDCRHDLQGGIIDPPDPACRLEQRLVYMSPDGVYMGLVEGQSSSPSKPPQARPPAETPSKSDGSPGAAMLPPSTRPFFEALDAARIVQLGSVHSPRILDSADAACALLDRGWTLDRTTAWVANKLRAEGLDWVTDRVAGEIVSIAFIERCLRT